MLLCSSLRVVPQEGSRTRASLNGLLWQQPHQRRQRSSWRRGGRTMKREKPQQASLLKPSCKKPLCTWELPELRGRQNCRCDHHGGVLPHFQCLVGCIPERPASTHMEANERNLKNPQPGSGCHGAKGPCTLGLETGGFGVASSGHQPASTGLLGSR